MPQQTPSRPISYKTEERLHALSHGVGALLSCAGLYALLLQNSQKTPYATQSLLLYGISLILLFSASTAYHLVQHPKWKHRLRILDHISIYILIAGTYSPVCLITLESGNGWLIFYTVWGIAFLGTVLKLFFTGKFEYISLFLYLGMGWLIVIDLNSLVERTSTQGLLLLGAGGVWYTLGVLFYSIRRIPYNHLIWHFFVLGGAACHWIYIFSEVA